MAKAKKLPSGSWRCRVLDHYEITYDEEGKKHRKAVMRSFTVADPTAAGRKECERQAAVFAASRERISQNDLTVREAIRAYIDLKANIFSPTTYHLYEGYLKTAYGAIEDIRTARLSQTDVQAWMNEYAADPHHSARTCRNVHGLLTAALAIYEPQLRLRTDLPKIQKSQLYTPTDEDIRKLLKYIEGRELEKAVLLAAFGTLRRGEICALTDEDISGNTIRINKAMKLDTDGKTFCIREPKTPSSNRSVVYPEEVIRKFDGIKGRLVDLNPTQISHQFYHATKGAGIPHFRFHDLRAYSISIGHAIGIPDIYLQHRGGWSTPYAMQAFYKRTISAEETKFTDQINAHFSELVATDVATK